MVKLIGIAGTHCAGKSTLLEDLCEDLMKEGVNVCKINEVARDVTRKERTSLYAQYFILSEQVRREEEAIANEKYDIVLSDRTVFDNISYVSLNLQSHVNHIRDVYGVLSSCWTLFLSNVGKYSRIVLVDEYFDIDPKDPCRNPQVVWQEWIKKYIECMLTAFYPKEIDKVKGGRKHRIDITKEIVLNEIDM